VLDNCEHLIDACAALADALLRACPSLRILATSREALGIAGERAWLVPSLSLPDSQNLPPFEELARYGAVRLFGERAGAAASAFELTERNAPAVAGLCQRLDGIPLAIELAAARVRVLSVEQIASRLEDSFELLTGGSRTALPRQRTLRATIEWSHKLLSQKERALFRRLSVFAGGFTLETAEGVCAGVGLERENVLDLLSRLVDRSLVLVAGQDGEARYRFLETVRQYGAEKLKESGEELEIRHLHAGFFLELAETAEPALVGPEQVAWLDRLEREHDNLREALSWSLGGGDTQIGLALAGTLWSFWYTHGHLSEGRRWLENAISESGPSTTRARAKALNGAGYIALFQGDYGAAKRFFEEALALYRRLTDKEGIASSLIYLGFVAVLSQQDLETVPALYEEVSGLRPKLQERRVVANLLLFSGLIAISRGEMQRAEALHEEALELFRGMRDVQGMGHCLNNLGLGAVVQGDYGKASRYLRENLRLAQESDYKLAILYSLFGLGHVAASREQPTHAARLWGAAQAIEETFGIRLSPLARTGTNYEGHQAAARSQLDEAAWEAAWAEGKAMTLEQAIEYALATPSPATPQPKNTAELSAREVEVLTLVAEGLTDSQVADRLYLSPRTVGQHLRSIYQKLGASSRTAAVKEALGRGLI
jgi:predicted ATPase/DNA-binding CsgD family transcriptional regulator